MLDWPTWHVDLLLSAGGIVASWFAGKDTPGFLALQVGFGMLVLAAIVCLFASLPVLVGNWRSRSPRRASRRPGLRLPNCEPGFGRDAAGIRP